MKQNLYTPEDTKIALTQNRCLVKQKADEAMIAFCQFLQHHNLKVSQDLLSQIPVKSTPSNKG